VLPSYCDALTDRWQPVAPASGQLTVMKHNLNTALQVTALRGMEHWLQQLGDLRLKLFIDLLPSRVNDLLKLSERYRIDQLFWLILSTIGLSHFHTIVLTLMTSYVWHCFSVSALIAWKNTGAYYISALSCHTALIGQNSVGSKTKRPRPRPRPVWDRSCHKTAVSDPKTATHSAVMPQ